MGLLNSVLKRAVLGNEKKRDEEDIREAEEWNVSRAPGESRSKLAQSLAIRRQAKRWADLPEEKKRQARMLGMAPPEDFNG